ncbi:MAG: META domain-containing protein [Anaerolineae bacterium]|nr:MAG: META domain-containing protein [Anaerolineae bacterium]
MKHWTVILAGSAILVLAACAPAGEDASLEGTLWALESYQDSEGETIDALPDSGARAEFEDGELSGTSGCNSFFGSYEVDGNSISIGPLGSTLMACPEPLMEQEFGFTSSLQSAATYEISGDTLTLSYADSEVVVTFVEGEPLSLTGANWIATRVNNSRGGVQSVVIGNEITALFSDDGSLSGSAGCNNYSGTYEVDGDSMTIGPLAATEKFCEQPEGTMEQEQDYLAALGTVATWKIDGDQLDLRTAEGSRAAAYTAGAPVE